MTLAGGVLVIFFVFIALVGPVFVSRDPIAQELGRRLSPPTRQYPFGTDSLGRDVFSRVIFEDKCEAA